VCNTHKSGNLTEYRIRLIEKIGLKTVEELENTNHIKKWSIEELKNVCVYYKEKIALLQ
jgi:hypothetical protein